MPFKSQAQRRWMYANHPEMAKQWSKETPKDVELPEKVAGLGSYLGKGFSTHFVDPTLKKFKSAFRTEINRIEQITYPRIKSDLSNEITKIKSDIKDDLNKSWKGLKREIKDEIIYPDPAIQKKIIGGVVGASILSGLSQAALDNYLNRSREKTASVIFWDGFLKTALDLKSAKKAVDALKPHLIRRDVTVMGKKPSEMHLGFGKGHLLGPVTTASPKSQEAKKLVESQVGKGTPSKTIFAKSGLNKVLKKVPKNVLQAPKATQEKEMVNRMVLMHEGLERKAMKKGLSNYKTHADPSVILGESNMVAALKNKFPETKQTFKTLRKLDTSAPDLEKNIKGFEYGEKRYSRHALKHMNDILKQKGIRANTENELVNTYSKPQGQPQKQKTIGERALNQVNTAKQRFIDGFKKIKSLYKREQ